MHADAAVSDDYLQWSARLGLLSQNGRNKPTVL